MKGIFLGIIVTFTVLTDICLYAQVKMSSELHQIVRSLKKSKNIQKKRELTHRLVSHKKVDSDSLIDDPFLESFKNSFNWFVRYLRVGSNNIDFVYCDDFGFATADFNEDGKIDVQGTYIFATKNYRYGVTEGFHLSQSRGGQAKYIDSVFAKDVNLDGKIDLITMWRDTKGSGFIVIHKILPAVPQKEPNYIGFGNKGEIYLSRSKEPENTLIIYKGKYRNKKELIEILGHKQLAFEYFNQGDYERAVEEFKKAFGIRSSHDTLNYYLALCELKTGKSRAARGRFFDLAQAPYSPFYDSAFYHFLDLIPQNPAPYRIKFVGTIPESLTWIKPNSYLFSSDFDGDKRPDLFFGSEGISIYLAKGKIIKSEQRNFSPFWLESKKKMIQAIASMSRTLYFIKFKEKDKKLVFVDTVRMTGLPKLFLSYYGLKICESFGKEKSGLVILVDNGPGPPKPNKSFIVKLPFGKILQEIDLNVEASSFSLSASKNTFYVGSFYRPDKMNKGTLPCVVRFTLAPKQILIDTIFVFPYDAPFPDDFFYGAGFVGIREIDLENDGKLELLLQESHVGEDSEHMYILRIVSEDTDTWNEVWNGRFHFCGRRTLAADIDGDGIKEIFTDNNTGYCKDHVPHIKVIRKIGDSWTQEKLLFPNCYLLDSGDFDRDGSEEVMIMRGPSWREKSWTLWLVDREE